MLIMNCRWHTRNWFIESDDEPTCLRAGVRKSQLNNFLKWVESKGLQFNNLSQWIFEKQKRLLQNTMRLSLGWERVKGIRCAMYRTWSIRAEFRNMEFKNSKTRN